MLTSLTKLNITILSLLSLTLLLTLSNSKLFEQDYTFSYLRRNKGWIFLDRIKLGKGQAQVRFNTRLDIKQSSQPTETYMLELAIVPDALWPTQSMLKCSKEAQSSQQDSQNKIQIKQSVLVTQMTPQNLFNQGLLQTFQVPQTQTYHFVLRDCQKNLLNQYFNRESRLIIELQVKNNGKDYGQDQANNIYWLPFLIAGTILMLLFVRIKGQSANQSSIDGKDTDYAKILVVVCIWFNLISLVFKYVGYLIYLNFGVDYNFFDFMYLFFHSIGDSIIVALFLFIAFGWTITFINGKDFDLYVPLISMMGLISVILTLLNKITDGSHDKYHMYDTIPAYLLVFFKAITIIIFIVGCVKTYLESTKQPKIQRFMIQILVLGGLYLFSIPLIMIIVEYIPTSERKQWVFIMIELAKNFICLLLTYMISYKKSGYRAISFSDQSFMQQNGKVL